MTRDKWRELCARTREWERKPWTRMIHQSTFHVYEKGKLIAVLARPRTYYKPLDYKGPEG